MRRSIVGSIAVAVLALIGFYVAWPAYSGYRIKTALDQRNPDLLARKIDFDGVRASLSPIVTAKVDDEINARIAQMGGLAQVLAPKLKKEIAPKIVELALNTLVTPETMIRIAADGGSIKESIERIMKEQLAKMGGGIEPVTSGDTPPGTVPGPASLGGLIGAAAKRMGPPPAGGTSEPMPGVTPAPPANASAPEGRRKFTLANIKSFAMTGLASFAIGVNRNPAATAPELVAEMAFRGGDWKLVGVTPKL